MLALGLTAARTTASAFHQNVRKGSEKNDLVNLASIMLSGDSLENHITRYKLGLKLRAPIKGDGDCFFSSTCDLIKLYGHSGPQDPSTLRLAVTEYLKKHHMKAQWVKSIFGGRNRNFNQFLKYQSKSGVFVDNNGLYVLGTAEYLKIAIHIVGTSNNAQDPVTKINES